MGLSQRELQWLEGKNLSAGEICTVYRTPKMMVGVPGESTFRNYETAKESFYDETVIPDFESMLDELNCHLAPRFSEDHKIIWKEEDIPALKARQVRYMESLDGVSMLTINEKRQKIKMEKLDGGDTIYQQSSLVPLGFGDMTDAEAEMKAILIGGS